MNIWKELIGVNQTFKCADPKTNPYPMSYASPEGDICNNDFECHSNVCLNGACVAKSTLGGECEGNIDCPIH